MPLFHDLTLNSGKKLQFDDDDDDDDDKKMKYTYSHSHHKINGYAEYTQPNILHKR